jgi:hypothetical protein
MYKYLVAFVLLTPLIGIWLVEGGEYAPSIGTDGYPIGATAAFSVYAVAVAVIAWLVAGRAAPVAELAPTIDANIVFRRFASNVLIVNGAFLALFLFGFGAINVWLGSMGKGEFRVSLGWFGAVPNLMCKFVLPTLVAYATLLYMRSTRNWQLKLRLALVFALAFTTGASWGFKTTAIASVMPALLLLNWRVRPVVAVALAGVFIGSLAIFFFLFDQQVEAGAEVQTFLLRRLTVLQGDVAWHIWDMHTSGEEFPNYWTTLSAGIGDKLLAAFGVSRSDPYEWMLYHYDWMLTYLAGSSFEAIEEGHSVTATPFAEGLVAGGLPGLALFAVLAGVLTGLTYRFINDSMRRGQDVRSALGATYCCYYIIAWLNGGAIVQLFHISLLIGFGMTLVLLVALIRTGLPRILPHRLVVNRMRARP